MAAPPETPPATNPVVLYARYADGTITPVQVDSTGAIMITGESGGDQSISDGSATDTTGNITTSTGTVTAANLDGYSTVTMSIQGTYGGFTSVFEQSDDGGTSWFAVDAERVGSGIVENGCTLLTNATLLYRATCSGSDSFRIRATALASGTVAVRLSITALPTSSGAAITTNFTDYRPDSGSITVVDSATSTATGQNGALLTTGAPTAGSSFAIATNGVAGFYALVTGTWTGTIQFEKSIDGGTTYAPTSMHIDSTGYAQIAITANCSMRGASAGATNVRARATATMTGTAVVRFVFAAADTVTTVNNSVRLFNPYPSGAIPITATSGLVNAGTATATLAAVAGLTTYIAGFEACAGGATAAGFVSIVITNTITGSLTYRICATNGTTFVPAPVPLVVNFDPPIPASAVNTTIVVTMGSTGSGGTNAVVNARGYQLA